MSSQPNGILSAWHKLMHIGIDDELTYSEKARVKITNRLVLINTLLVLLYMVMNYLTRPQNVMVNPWWVKMLNIGSISLAVPVLLLNHFRLYTVARILMIAFLLSALLISSLSWSMPYRTELYFFALAAFVYVVFQQNKWVAILVYSLPALAFAYVLYNNSQQYPEWGMVPATLILRVVISFSLLFFVIYFLTLEGETYQEELEMKNIQLAQERDEMQKLSFTKDKIFSIISHDLRSPIASLQSLLTLINDDTLSKEDFKKATVGLEKQVFQLRNSLDELLTWSRAQLHGINAAPDHVNLRQAIVQVVSVQKTAARGKRIIITTQLDPNLTVYCDPSMLHSIFTNLVSNAIKFTPVGGAISLSAEPSEKGVCIQVEDTGIGIPAGNIKQILNPSTLFTTRGTNNEKGTGLGIAMCAEFIQKNNGTFTIDSEDGKGSRFKVVLPIKP